MHREVFRSIGIGFRGSLHWPMFKSRAMASLGNADDGLHKEMGS